MTMALPRHLSKEALGYRIHTNRELGMMLRREKPLAIFTNARKARSLATPTHRTMCGLNRVTRIRMARPRGFRNSAMSMGQLSVGRFRFPMYSNAF